MRVTIEIDDCQRSQHVHIVPGLSSTVDQREPVVPTPQYRTNRCFDPRSLLLMFELPIGKQTTISTKFLDAGGNVTKPDGVPVWGSDNTDVVAITPSTDGLSCLVKTLGPITLTPVTISMTADADRGTAVRAIIGTFQLTVTGGDAQTVVLDASPPEDQPPVVSASKKKH